MTGSSSILVRDLRLRLAGTRAALADRNMAALLFTWGAWITTDWAFLIAVSVMALEVDGPAAVGLVGAARVLPAAIGSGLVTVVADRVAKPLLLAGVNILWALIALIMAWFAATEAPIGALVAVLVVGSAVSSLLKPCIQSTLPQLVRDPGQLIVANSAYSTTEGAGTVLGPVICGLLLAGSGPAAVFVVLAVIYAAAAVVGGRVRTPFQPARPVAGRGLGGLAVLSGFRLLLSRGPRTVFALFMMQTCMRGFVNVFVILVATSVPGGSEAKAGTLFAAIGVGGLIGSVVGLAGGGGRSGVGRFAVGIALWGVPVAVIGIWTDFAVAWWALAVLGFGNAVADIYGFTLLNRLIPDHVAGRAWGAFHSGSAAVVALGSLAAPALASAVGLSWAMIIAGAVLAVAPAVAWVRLREVSAHASGRAEDVELFGRVPLFAPLSPISIERLARAAQPVAVDSGAVVVSQGAAAMEFYVVAEGELAVSQDGVEVRRLHPGDAFGEIALLQAGVRTATVTAVGPARMLTLDRSAFVAAVTGHRPTDDLARQTVDQRLSDDRDRQRGSQNGI